MLETPKNQIPSSAGIRTNRSDDDLSRYEREVRHSKNTRTYYHLADMAFKIKSVTWGIDNCFYYEDKKEPFRNIFCSIADIGGGEMSVTSRGCFFESLSLRAYSEIELIEFFLDVLGIPENERVGLNYTGNHKNLGDDYVKYAQYLI
jgi:hypothetical protein